MDAEEQIAADTVIWRYMDFTRFVAMLEHQGLYFTRADLLGDPFEGTFTPGSIEALAAKMPEAKMRPWSEIVRTLRNKSYVTCWHESTHESAALWNLYGDSLAIRSTYERLRAFLPVDLYDIARVKYIDYEVDHPDIHYSAGALLYKRAPFAHEREIRAIMQTFTYEGEHPIAYEPAGLPGDYANGNLDELIEAVIVAPGTPAWRRELVSKVGRKCGLDLLTLSSKLD